jgi:hypothetical protein
MSNHARPPLDYASVKPLPLNRNAVVSFCWAIASIIPIPVLLILRAIMGEPPYWILFLLLVSLIGVPASFFYGISALLQFRNKQSPCRGEWMAYTGVLVGGLIILLICSGQIRLEN